MSRTPGLFDAPAAAALDDGFEPTPAAARERLARVDPALYAKTRNHLEGAVTRLSPYVTHGLLTIPQAVAALHARRPLRFDDKLVFEFAWREFFHHAWRHLGDRILVDVREPVWPGRYADALPADVLEARTGVPAVDRAVEALHATGWLHNHARMWLASYLVHLRKVHWRAGADWMVGHLLDGDLASNHLSWQWVAGTFSSKPYLFNAGNVAKFAPRPWASPGTVVDADYASLEAIARGAEDVGPEPGHASAAAGPAPALHAGLQAAAPGVGPPAIDAAALATRIACEPADRPVHLVHPWDLGDDAHPQARVALQVAVLHAPFHRRFPWSARRWAFVGARWRERCEALVTGDLLAVLAAIGPALGGRPLRIAATLNPGYREAVRHAARRWNADVAPAPRLLPDPEQMCHSFTRFYERARRDAGSLEALLA